MKGWKLNYISLIFKINAPFLVTMMPHSIFVGQFVLETRFCGLWVGDWGAVSLFSSLLTLSNVNFLRVFCSEKLLYQISLYFPGNFILSNLYSYFRLIHIISEFCKWVIFEKQRHSRSAVQGKFVLSMSYSFNEMQKAALSCCCEMVSIYIYICVSIY